MTDLIERRLELPATPAAVWRAVTDPRWLASWLADEARLELWPGGEARFVVDGEERGGWVEEVRPPRAVRLGGRGGPLDGDDGNGSGRLVFWWGPDEEPATRVELTIAAGDGGTVLRVVETRPLESLDVIGMPLPGAGSAGYGPVLLAA